MTSYTPDQETTNRINGLCKDFQLTPSFVLRMAIQRYESELRGQLRHAKAFRVGQQEDWREQCKR